MWPILLPITGGALAIALLTQCEPTHRHRSAPVQMAPVSNLDSRRRLSPSIAADLELDQSIDAARPPAPPAADGGGFAGSSPPQSQPPPQVPGPLGVAGAIGTWGFSRKLRQRIRGSM
jgi:hypothetical protein